jgi:O-antigen/teichoic acid export membrane protein
VQRALAGSGLARRSTVLFAGRLVAAGTSAAWLFLAARTLGVEQFGDLALLLAVYGMFAVVADLGLPILLAGRVAHAGAIEPGLVRTVIVQRLVGGLAATVLVVLTFAVAASDHDLIAPLLFAGSILGNAVHSTYSAALRSVGVVLPESVNEVLSRILVLGMGVLLIKTGLGVRGAAIAYSVADLASSVALRRIVQRHWVTETPTDGSSRITLGEAVPLGVAAALGGLYYRIDAWLLGVLRNASTTGIYSAGYRFLEVITLPAAAAGAVAIGDLATLEPTERRRRVRSLAAGVAVVTAALSLVVALLAEPIITHTFGPDFVRAVPVLRVLLVAAVPTAIVSALGPLTAVGQRRDYALALAFALAFNVALNVALIPRYGAVGAAWANAGSQTLLAVGFLVTLTGRPRSGFREDEDPA